MFMHGSKEEKIPVKSSPGIVMTTPAWVYDLMARWFVMRGREQEFRRMAADLAQLQSGEAVLDVGCGTGTQALVAKQRVGATGHVCGIDPSASLLAGARRKAMHSGLSIDFQPGGIEQLPYPDQSFDVVLSTFMMHHLPDDIKRQGLAEIARVLRPGGRLLVIDFMRSEEHQDHPEQFGAGDLGLQDFPALMSDAGFSQTQTGEIPFRIRSVAAGHQHYGFVKAKKD